MALPPDTIRSNYSVHSAPRIVPHHDAPGHSTARMGGMLVTDEVTGYLPRIPVIL